jgi:hypothetical protein
MNAHLLRPAAAAGLLLLASACEKKPPPPAPAPAAAASGAPAGRFDRVPRAELNRLAAEVALPIFWTEDRNRNGALDPDELAVYWGLEPGASLADYVRTEPGGGARFTPRATEAYATILRHLAIGARDDDPRRAAVKKELAQGRVTLVATDLSGAPAEERAFARAILRAAQLVEVLYAKQQGVHDLAAKVPRDDPASRTLFFRNQSARCEAPATHDDPSCSALLPADRPGEKRSGLYRTDELSRDPRFCERLLAEPALRDPFVIAVQEGPALVPVPYDRAWPEEMSAIARELDDARAALGEREPALREYLRAAAAAFRDNAWWPADEAWSKMDARSSKYFLRVAPDEVYDEPCSTKALFHLTFGLVNQGSVKWQTKLDPRKTEMESALAALAGPPYRARTVSFKLPDFVDIALNAGDARKAFGATIGQSLPNFGPVANGGRGRTVAMTSFYTDRDSIDTAREQAASLFCKEVFARWTSEPEPQLMSTVLHEAAHNLGPAHQYRAAGKIDRESFGGPLASTLEELKAQTAALYFTDWLVEKKEITREDADRAHVRDVFWAFGHVSRGMYGEGKHPKNYGQLAAIQLGWLLEDGAATWQEATLAANGKDRGCLAVDLARLPDAIKRLMVAVVQIKARGDRPRAEALVAEHVDVRGERKKLHDVITERMTRAPKASFVYAIKLE